MSAQNPTVTVLVTAYNASRYLRAALDSVLAQRYQNLELVVVDDGSTDDTGRILRGYTDPRLRIIQNDRNLGIPRSANRGLEIARGKYVARLDADDVALPNRLARQVSFLETNPEIAVVGSDVQIIDARDRVRRVARPVRAFTPLGVQSALLFGTPFAHSTVMYRRRIVAEELGGYDERFAMSEDFELFSRVLARYSGVNLPEQLVHFRVHADSATAQGANAREARMSEQMRNLDVHKANILRILGQEHVAETWPPLWTSVNVSWLMGAPRSERQLHDYVAEMRQRFGELYPESRRDREVARVFASVLAHIACFLASTQRQHAFRAFAEAMRVDSRTGVRCLPKLALHGAIGEKGLSIARQMRRSFA